MSNSNSIEKNVIQTSINEDILYKSGEGIATITLNRPKKFNALRPLLLKGLEEALRRANCDPSVKVIVLEGNGDSFCAGFDFGDG